MPTNNQLRALLVIVVVLWVAVLLFQGQTNLSLAMLRPFSYVLTGLTFVLLAWDRWAWHWPVFKKWLNKRPDIRGTWKGTLQSDWEDKTIGKTVPPIDVFLVVRQTYSATNVRLFSEESTSVSLSANIVTDSDELSILAVTYHNTPNILCREHSPIHDGGMLAKLIGNPLNKLSVEYWTDRKTKGSGDFTRRSSALPHDFEEASKIKFKTNARNQMTKISEL